MLYFVFTVDGDWKKYYFSKLSPEERAPNLKELLHLVDTEMDIAQKYLKGKLVHFIHTSPRARDFFLKLEFISRWKKIEDLGGNIGVHCHEDDPGKAYYYDDPKRMEKSISSFTNSLKNEGLSPLAYRSGYMAFNSKMTSILEANRILLDFSCEPGIYEGPMEGIILSDWRGAPRNFYRMDYEDYRKAGKSNVFEIPVGKASGRALHFDKSSVFAMRTIARCLEKEAGKEDFVVSVLAHTYDFRKKISLLNMKLAFSILKRYGRFINAEEALGIVRKI